MCEPTCCQHYRVHNPPRHMRSVMISGARISKPSFRNLVVDCVAHLVPCHHQVDDVAVHGLEPHKLASVGCLDQGAAQLPGSGGCNGWLAWQLCSAMRIRLKLTLNKRFYSKTIQISCDAGFLIDLVVLCSNVSAALLTHPLRAMATAHQAVVPTAPT